MQYSLGIAEYQRERIQRIYFTTMPVHIRQVETDTDIERCFTVMSQLRPHLIQSEFVQLVRSQMQQGYRLACAMDGDDVACVAGYRINRSLSWGKFLYIDDLVTDEARRSRGFGKVLIQWLVDEAKKQGCQELHLDSGTQRKDAHRFYEREGMDMIGYHYKLAL